MVAVGVAWAVGDQVVNGDKGDPSAVTAEGGREGFVFRTRDLGVDKLHLGWRSPGWRSISYNNANREQPHHTAPSPPGPAPCASHCPSPALQSLAVCTQAVSAQHQCELACNILPILSRGNSHLRTTPVFLIGTRMRVRYAAPLRALRKPPICQSSLTGFQEGPEREPFFS
ncbi:protein of unknown function [Candidatus Methylomirabilis oxygeniifera]|uniref:Uncharacterized protein n=1 Tax=Methylomirabilis oxygeniifera TaxID=671143 RepID=D5MG03_METO1|nr:protein of unknown function [Candidatus Methylomirabilis oxyfera]